ncbi:hypothetical protein GGX14DRAFT_455544 [Mycena pura]|uniref:Uncharacterized protein n=1 Tax=Mycena pura TaxID=153505 RepID=A0AAD6YFP2_9AGAR|nr:hypothetical protein GGX14DRAFT_455544 [Mycena pura]
MALDTFGDFGLEVGSNYLCEGLRLTAGLIIVVQEVIIGLDKRVLILLLCIGVAIVTVAAWSIVPAKSDPTPQTSAPGCYFPLSKAQLAGDILVVCLTLYQSYAQRNGPLSAVSLWRIMIREGSTYIFYSNFDFPRHCLFRASLPMKRTDVPDDRCCSIICLLNLANILMLHIYISDSLSWLTSAVSVAMISRLMLNLHVAAAREIGVAASGMDANVELETIRFMQRSGTAFRGE